MRILLLDDAGAELRAEFDFGAGYGEWEAAEACAQAFADQLLKRTGVNIPIRRA